MAPTHWGRPDHWEVIGIDITPGPGVDVVADAHVLSRHFEPRSFDAVYSIAVFEHLLLPWKVALEINRLLVPGGVAWITSHEGFPIHEEPWDFYRFGAGCWAALFNERTGFEVIEGRPAGAATVRPWARHVPSFRSHMHCEVHVRKIGEPHAALAWDIALADALPAGHCYAAGQRLARALWHRVLHRLPRRASPADPFGLARLAVDWHVIAGPDARDLAVRAAKHTPLPEREPADSLGEILRGLPERSVPALALLDVLQRHPRPWSLVSDIHRVLAPGGLVYVDTVHTAPTSFTGWRLSSEALLGLFNGPSGFRLERRAMLDPCSIVADDPDESPLPQIPAYLRTLGLARNVGEFDGDRLSWS